MRKTALLFTCLPAAALLAAASLAAQPVLPANQWVELAAPAEKLVLEDLSADGMYYGLAAVPLSAGGAYTLFAEWEDGRGMLVLVRGADPRVRNPSPPSGAGRMAALNTSGGRESRINFRVDPRSPGNAGYLVFASHQPGRRVRLLLKDPGDPDAVTAGVVNGRTVGTVFSTPLWASGQAAAAAGGAAVPAPAPGPEGTLPLNRWVELRAPAEKAALAAYPGAPQHYRVAPVRLEKGGRYTLFAEWGDGKAMLLTLRGHDPAFPAPSAPSGTYGQVSLNISGGGAWRINFTVDAASRGDTGWLVFPASSAGRSVRVMIKSPGDPDEVTGAVEKGFTVGSVYRTPLHLSAAGR